MSRLSIAVPRLLLALVLLLLGGVLAGCGSSRSVSVDGASTQPARTASQIESQLRAAADEWEGIPQKWGGTSKQGVDCSGLVQSVYASRFQLSLPRTTDQQVRTGTRVSRSALRPGDLVFFRHGRKEYHVGIYLSDGEFLHTSTSEGVTISPLDRSYWEKRWWQGRRLLDLPNRSQASTAGAEPSSSSSEGIGW